MASHSKISVHQSAVLCQDRILAVVDIAKNQLRIVGASLLANGFDFALLTLGRGRRREAESLMALVVTIDAKVSERSEFFASHQIRASQGTRLVQPGDGPRHRIFGYFFCRKSNSHQLAEQAAKSSFAVEKSLMSTAGYPAQLDTDTGGRFFGDFLIAKSHSHQPAKLAAKRF